MAAIIIGISSCEKEIQDADLPFSQLTEEDNKQLVENSAIEAVKALDALKDEAAIDASVSMVSYLSMADPMETRNGKKSKVRNTLEVLAGLNSDESNVNDIFKALVSPDELAEDPATLEALWADIKGTYTWNASMEGWDFAENADAVVFLFPSTENGTSNNATFTISNFESVMMQNPLDEEYDGELPVSLKVLFEVDGSEVLSMRFAAEYNTDGIPSSVAADLMIGTFKFAIDGTNTDTKITGKYSFTNAGDVIMEINATVEGDITQESIDANTHTHTETYEWTDYVWNDATQMYEEVVRTETYSWDEVDVEQILQSGNFKFQLYNISIAGNGDFKSVGEKMDEIYPDEHWNDSTFDDKAAAEAEAAAMNEYLHMYAIDENTRVKIAEVQAYVVEDNYYEDYVDYRVDFRLVYGDGSLVDLETYFDSGFEDVVSEINGIIRDLNTKYELELEPIDY